MLLFLLRHGIAEDNSPDGDAHRELTDEGKSKLSDVLKRAGKAGVKPDLILTSPLVRAKQTADMAEHILGCDTPPQQTEVLVPGGTPQGIWNLVRENRGLDQLLLAGHEPLFSQTVAYLLNAPTMQIDFKKAGLVAIGFDSFRGEPRGELKWMLIPKLCG